MEYDHCAGLKIDEAWYFRFLNGLSDGIVLGWSASEFVVCVNLRSHFTPGERNGWC